MTSPTVADPPTDTAQDQVLDEVLEHADEQWKATAFHHITELARRGTSFEAYDLFLNGCPEPSHPSRWGAVLRKAAELGWIRETTPGPSSRPTVRGSLCKRWIGTAS